MTQRRAADIAETLNGVTTWGLAWTAAAYIITPLQRSGLLSKAWPRTKPP